MKVIQNPTSANLLGGYGLIWKVRDLKTNKTAVNDELKWVKFSGAHWLRDGRGVLYSRFAIPAGHN